MFSTIPRNKLRYPLGRQAQAAPPTWPCPTTATPSSSLPWTLDLGPNFDFAHTAGDRKTIRRFAKSPPPVQSQSHFLRLSGEIRNAIYLEAVKLTLVLDIYSNRVAAPALARVCRQIECEYWDVYVELAPVYAESVRLYDPERVADLVNRLPATNSENPDPAARTYTLVSRPRCAQTDAERRQWAGVRIVNGYYNIPLGGTRSAWWPKEPKANIEPVKWRAENTVLRCGYYIRCDPDTAAEAKRVRRAMAGKKRRAQGEPTH